MLQPEREKSANGGCASVRKNIFRNITGKENFMYSM